MLLEIPKTYSDWQNSSPYKSLVVSQLLVYILSPLNLNGKAIKEVNKLLMYSFLWNGKGDKIKQNIFGEHTKITLL